MSLRGFVLFTILVFSVVGYPTGPPFSICDNMENIHNTTSQPMNALPYIISASSRNFNPGDIIELKIEGNNFRGFFFKAYDSATNNPIGNFLPQAYTITYDLCSGIAHSEPSDKDKVVLQWQAPSDKTGSVYFKGIIVQRWKIYWSPVIAQYN